MAGRLPQEDAPLPAAGALEQLVARLVDQRVEDALRKALKDAPGLDPRQMTIARWARTRGHGYATARRWVKAAGLRPAPGGKYLTAELETLPRAPAPAAPPVADLAAARARRAAESLLGKAGR